MKYPIIINENGYVFFIDSEKSVSYLEPIDVLNEEYTAYDSNGLQLQLTIKTRKMAFGRKINEVVISHTDQRPNMLSLRNVLLVFLNKMNIKLVNEKYLSLNDLIEIAGRHTDHF